MQITFYPQRRDDHLKLERLGDTLILNGEAFDFSPVGEGDILPAEAINSDLLTFDITRENGALLIGISLPHGPSPADDVAFPEPITVTDNGPIAVPGGEV